MYDLQAMCYYFCKLYGWMAFEDQQLEYVVAKELKCQPQKTNSPATQMRDFFHVESRALADPVSQAKPLFLLFH